MINIIHFWIPSCYDFFYLIKNYFYSQCFLWLLWSVWKYGYLWFRMVFMKINIHYYDYPLLVVHPFYPLETIRNHKIKITIKNVSSTAGQLPRSQQICISYSQSQKDIPLLFSCKILILWNGKRFKFVL